MKSLKRKIRDRIREFGVDIGRYRSPLEDMKLFLEQHKNPLILDIGGNEGQTVKTFSRTFPDATIHSFEPSPTTYKILCENTKGIQGVKTWNNGVGSQPGTLPFLENTSSEMSSFLAPSSFAWGKVETTTNVEVVSVDSFASQQGIDFIHILKSDTQGYDYEVFKGAEGLMKENKIALVYFEFIFSDMYKNLPPFHEVLRYLAEQNFILVSFYESYYQKDLVSWTDLLFVNREFNSKRVPRHEFWMR